jgi:hypothetical protein
VYNSALQQLPEKSPALLGGLFSLARPDMTDRKNARKVLDLHLEYLGVTFVVTAVLGFTRLLALQRVVG